MASKLMAVIKREYLERVRTKWFIISTVFGPVFMLSVTLLPALESDVAFTVGATPAGPSTT